MDKRKPYFQRLAQIGLAAAICLLQGCATPTNIDPVEPFNRVMFKIDRDISQHILGPIVDVYDKGLPTLVHKGVRNFFSNTVEPARIVNDLLQADIDDALNDMGRLIVNTTVGIGGLFDIATDLGMEKHRNDFGITLAKWGVRRSAYLYIPILGPFTVRDTFSLGLDYFVLNPISYINTDKIRLSILTVGKIHYEWRLLPAQRVINEAFDPYIFVRDAYLQKRNNMINEVVVGHHAAKDSSIHDYEDLEITDEDHQEAKEKNQALNGIDEDAEDKETKDTTKQDASALEDVPQVVAPKKIAPQDIGQQDIAPQDIGQQDIAPQDIAPQDIAPQDIAPQDIAPQDIAPQDIAPQVSAQQDTTSPDTAPVSLTPPDSTSEHNESPYAKHDAEPLRELPSP